MKIQTNIVNVGFKKDDGTLTRPLPKQKKVLEVYDKKKHTLAHGSFGWGKTDVMIAACVFDILEFPGNVALLGRKHLDSFTKSTLDSLLRFIPQELIKRHNKQEHEIELFNRSKIIYMQLDSSKEAIAKINSMNLGFFGVDQLEEIDEEVWAAGIGRLRRQRSRRKSLCTCNPKGHDWVWNKFIRTLGKNDTGAVGGSIWKEGIPPPSRQADVTFDSCDNPYLTYDYIANLLTTYPERWIKRYIYGSWENFEGLVWAKANQQKWPEGHVVKPRELPEWYNRYVILDHGHRNPTAALFVAVDGDDNWWLYDCHHEAGRWVDYHATVIKAKMGEHNFAGFLADPSIFHQHESDQTIAAQYQDFGLFFEPANNDLAGGIDHVARAFQENRIKVFDLPQFEIFWDEVLNYRWTDMRVQTTNDPEKPIKKDDHYPDVLRYMANHLYVSAKPEKPKQQRYWINRSYGHREKAFMGV